MFLGKVICIKGNEVQVWCLSNHMVYINLKNLNMKKMPYSTKGFSMQMSTQKWSRRGENGFGHIKNNHTVLLCTEIRKQKYKIVYFLSFCGNDSISLRSQLIFYAVFTQLIFIIWKGRVTPSFNIKTTAQSLLTLIECTSKPEGPF